MAKKQKRKIRLSPAQLVRPGMDEHHLGIDLEQEYAYVAEDLKQIGLTGLVMVLVVIVGGLLLI